MKSDWFNMRHISIPVFRSKSPTFDSLADAIRDTEQENKGDLPFGSQGPFFHHIYNSENPPT